jgi:hypothetical protein
MFFDLLESRCQCHIRRDGVATYPAESSRCIAIGDDPGLRDLLQVSQRTMNGEGKVITTWPVFAKHRDLRSKIVRLPCLLARPSSRRPFLRTDKREPSVLPGAVACRAQVDTRFRRLSQRLYCPIQQALWPFEWTKGPEKLRRIIQLTEEWQSTMYVT